MPLDRQAVERRDFPIGRRGYDPAAVDAHLRALAAELEELQRTVATGGPDLSMASTAGTQVQSIIEAAESAAAEIERTAQENARQMREEAAADAERTREQAIEKAGLQVAAVAQVTARLLERVGSMDADVNALIGSVRAGAGRLAADLTAVEAGMADLYGAASGGEDAGGDAPAVVAARQPPVQAEPPPPIEEPQPQPAAGAFEAALDSALAGSPQQAHAQGEPEGAEIGAAGGDLDGARLIALNMALNGESRTDTERYLAENFEIPDRLKLIDEVYAAIEG
ncbi:MAG TPA: DivIVA domain-containing protein [Solirubrobacteraceae bacterium]